jgi:hypothetical protein
MALTRPLKEGSVPTYQQKVALGFPDILASEMDADLDTIYAAWNGNIGTANLIDGAVTTAKIGNGQVTTAKLAVGATLATAVSSANFPASWGLSTTYNAYVTVLTLPALVTRGGPILVVACPGAQFWTNATGGGIITDFSFDGSWLGIGRRFTLIGPGGTTRVPVPATVWLDTGRPAGSHVYAYGIFQDGPNAQFGTSADNPGYMFAVELA